MSSDKVVPVQLWVILPLGTNVQDAFFAGDKSVAATESNFIQTSYYTLGSTLYPALLINTDASKINQVTEFVAKELGLKTEDVRASAVKLAPAKPVESGRDAPKVYG